MDSGEVLINRMNSNHRRVVFKLLAKAVCQARESAHPHSHRQVMPFRASATEVSFWDMRRAF
jgi:hypothetical protein